MLPFIGSIRNNCCSVLTRQETLQEDLDGGILTIVGVRMSNRSNRTMETSKEPCDNDHLPSLIDDRTGRIDSSTIESTSNTLYYQRMLARSMESLYPFGIKHSHLSSMRRYSHIPNDDERRRSLTWARPTMEERMARATRRISENTKSLSPPQFDPPRGVTLINL